MLLGIAIGWTSVATWPLFLAMLGLWTLACGVRGADLVRRFALQLQATRPVAGDRLALFALQPPAPRIRSPDEADSTHPGASPSRSSAPSSEMRHASKRSEALHRRAPRQAALA